MLVLRPFDKLRANGLNRHFLNNNSFVLREGVVTTVMTDRFRATYLRGGMRFRYVSI